MEIRAAAVVGTGTMGPGIAAVLALAGTPATLVSRTAATAMRGVFAAQAALEQLAANGLAPPAAVQAAVTRIFGADDVARAVESVDLVVESIVEDLALKKELFEQLDREAPAGAILASNTSGLSINEIARATSRPERVLTAHFWNPPHLMPLVEVTKGEKTDETVATRMMTILREAGKVPVLLRQDRPGQLANRMQAAMIREALNIVEQGIASVEDVDRAVRLGFGLRLPMWGPLQHADAVGLDLALAVQDAVLPDLYNHPRAPKVLRDKVSQGQLGLKTGRGFYDASTNDLEAAKKARDAFLIEFLRAHKNDLR